MSWFINKFIILILLLIFSFSCPDNCLFCSNKDKCVTCNYQFYLTEKDKCINKTIQNCRIYINEKQCSLCQPTFKIHNNICIKDFSGCIIRNNNGTCKQCYPGTTLNNKGECLGVLNCINLQKRCKKCTNNYNLSNNKCFYSGTDCQKINLNGLCTQCIEGYILNGFQCVNLGINSLSNSYFNFINNCSLYSRNQNKCLYCNAGFSILNNICRPSLQVYSSAANNKITQNSKNSLINTQSQIINYKKSIVGQDKKIDFLSSNKKDKITDLLSSNKTDKITDLLSNSKIDKIEKIDQFTFRGVGSNHLIRQNNCLMKYKTNNLCLICIDSYYLYKGICKKKTSLCISYNIFNFKCLKCNSNYALISGECIDLNCQDNQFLNCKKCHNKYQIHEQGYCYDINCQNIINGTCIKCKKYYNLTINNFCIKQFNPKCQKYNSNICILCNKEFSLIQGQCVDQFCRFDTIKNNITNCIKCLPGFTLNSKAICIDQNCLDSQNQLCIKCQENYYVNLNGLCIIVPNSCLLFDYKINKCKQCSIGYHLLQNKNCVWSSLVMALNSTNSLINNITQLINNQIFLNDPNCKSFNQKNICILCKDRYYLKDNKCVIIQKQCINFFRTNGSCFLCQTGFVLYSQNNNSTFSCLGKINKKDINCLKFHIDSYCIKCRSEYFISQGFCYKADNLCKTFKIYGGQCESCYDGYQLQGIKCILLLNQPNCIKFDFQNICIQCKLGYYLENTKKICRKVTNLCKISNQFKGICLSCFNDFVLQNGGCAKVNKISPNCKQINQLGICIQCKQRYYLQQLTAKCKQVNPLCNDYDKITGACKNCSFSYKLIKQLGVCVIENIDLFCSNYTYDGYCQKCIDNYLINTQKICVQKDILCMVYDQNSIKCIKCINSHYLVLDQCLIKYKKQKLSKHCIKSDQKNFCIQCQKTYYIQIGQCLKVHQFCQTYQMETGLCLKCKSNNFLVNKQCAFNNQTLISTFLPQNCDLFSGNLCIYCANGYYLNYNTQIPSCVKVDFQCEDYNKINGNCYDCIQGYIILNDKCILLTKIESLREDRQFLKN